MPRNLVAHSIYETKTAAGHFAKGFRGKSFGRPGKARGSVKVGKVGPYWGVYQITREPRVEYWTLEQGKAEGRRRYAVREMFGKRRRGRLVR